MGRLLVIGISALCGGLLFIWLFAIKVSVQFPDWLGLLLFGCSCAVGGAVAWHFCGRPKLKPIDISLIDYEELGLLVSEEFSARRHKDEHWVHSIICQGTYMKPEAMFPHYSKAYQKAFGFPSDGEIFTVSYDELYSRML